ncbi:MAG TPA: shikimate dehydrogenase [Rhizobiaceae bacterium]|nr:shikimate dehydrogenase [Rhizobiaceae bacterium]
MVDPVRRAFVCGHPIAHSRSPIIHSYWLDRYGIAGSYAAIDVAPERFPLFLSGLSEAGLAGGNITIPHKEAAFAAVARRDAAAEAIGAVNTVWFEDGQLHGGNTDAYGFAANLDERAPGWERGRSAVVVGAGGAARAVIHALTERSIGDIRVANRTAGRAAELAARFGARVSAHAMGALPEICADADLLINTTSLGMAGDMGLSADPAWLPGHAIVTDLVYVPLRTPLLAAAAARGLKTVDGLGMLLHQAVPGFERWFGRRPDVTQALRDRIVADLDGKT